MGNYFPSWKNFCVAASDAQDNRPRTAMVLPRQTIEREQIFYIAPVNNRQGIEAKDRRNFVLGFDRGETPGRKNESAIAVASG